MDLERQRLRLNQIFLAQLGNRQELHAATILVSPRQ
jgi:hypothetical protein